MLGCLLTAAAGTLFAQASGLSRVLVGKADVSVPGREAVIARVDVAPVPRPVATPIPATRSAKGGGNSQ